MSILRPALFLDRDGVINVDHGYVYRIDQFEFLPGAIDTMILAGDLGMAVIIITNQAGIGRGYYTERQFHTLMNWVHGQVAAKGGHINGIYFCPYHADGQPPYNIANHPDRKPNPGMIRRATADLRIDIARSAFIGDSANDMQAAESAGVANRGWFGHNLADHLAVQDWLFAIAERAKDLNR